MLGGVFGNTTGIAPGYKGSLSWWKLELYSEGEYVFDTGDSSDSFFYELHHAYGVKEILGFRGGYQGSDPAQGEYPIVLTSQFVDNIHQQGGTVLGTSRGPVDIGGRWRT